MNRFVCAAFGFAALFPIMPKLSGAEEAPPSTRIPIMAIEAGRAITVGEIEAVARGIGSPLEKDSDFIEKLSLFFPAKSGVVETMKAIFENGQDRFYSGMHGEAESEFEKISSGVQSDPALLIGSLELREIAFKSKIYLAAIADAGDDKEKAEQQLASAAVDFPDLKPSASEFPPWICERFASLRQSAEIGTGKISLETLPGCELTLSGKALGRGNRFKEIAPGRHTVQVKCLGRLSPLQLLRVNSGIATIFSPLLLGKLSPDFSEGRLKFKALKGETALSLVSEAVEVARYGGWPRAVVVVAAKDRTDLLLIDAGAGGVVRSESAPAGDESAAADAGEALAGGGKAELTGRAGSGAEKWYKDALAWTLVGVGAAAIGTGIALGQVFGTPSEEEKWLWALIAGGGGIAGSGIALFILPGRNAGEDEAGRRERGVAAGISVSGSF